MMRVAVSTVMGSLVIAAGAAAQPTTTIKVPTTTVPCAPDGDLELLAKDDAPVVCWDRGCMALSLHNFGATIVPKPAASPAWFGVRPELRAQGKGMAACNGTVCRPLGPRLTQALAKARAATDPVSATTDLKAVSIGTGAWSVTKDRPLVLAPPRAYGGGGFPQHVQAVGNVLLVEWVNCAGPCTDEQLVSSSGKNLGAQFSGGGPIIQVDDDHFVVVSEYGDLHLVSMQGKRLGDRAGIPMGYGSPAERLGAVRIGEDTVGVLYDDDSAVHVEAVHVGAGGLSAAGENTLPRCEP